MQFLRFAFLSSAQHLSCRTHVRHTVPLICRPQRYDLPSGGYCVRTTVARAHPLKTPNDGSKEERRDNAPSSSARRVSRTVIGRALVEILSLLLGALLLLVILSWRFWQFLSFNVRRAVSWMSNFNNLGKRAIRRLTHVDKIAIPAASLAQNLRHIYGAILPRVIRNRTLANNTENTETQNSATESEWNDVRDDKDNVHMEGRPVRHGHLGRRQSAKRRIILLRHAKTQWNYDGTMPDHERELSERGKEEAHLVGVELARLSWTPDVLISSNAVRTVQTFGMLNLSSDVIHSATSTDDLYYAVTGDEMVVAINNNISRSGFPDGSTLLVVCHNPGCEELVELLTGKRVDMGTGCAALLEYNARKRDELHNHSDDSDRNDDQSFSIMSEYLSFQWSVVDVIRPSTITTADWTGD